MSASFLGPWAGSPAPVRTSVRTLEGRYAVAKNYTMQQVAFQPRQATRLSYECVDEVDTLARRKSSKNGGDGDERDERGVHRRAFLLYNVFDTIYLFDFDLVPFEGRGVFQKRMKFHEHPSVHDVLKLPVSAPKVAEDAPTHSDGLERDEDTSGAGDESAGYVKAETGSFVALSSPERQKGAMRSLKPPKRPLLGAIIGFLSGDLLYVELPGRHKQRQFNEKGHLISQRVNGVKWLPESTTRFLAWFEGGGCYVYDMTRADVAHSSLRDLKTDVGLRVLSHVVRDPNSNPIAWWRFGRDALHEVEFSAAGTHVAAAVGPHVYVCRMASGSDGDPEDVLVPEPMVVFRSYYGQYLCVAWSPDDLYLAAGGEADTVSLFDVGRGCVVAYGTAHKSWVHRITFDSYRAAAGVYRLVSASADTSFVVWEVCAADMASVSGGPKAEQRSSQAFDGSKEQQMCGAEPEDKACSGSTDVAVSGAESESETTDEHDAEVDESRRKQKTATADGQPPAVSREHEVDSRVERGVERTKRRRKVDIITHPAPRLLAEALPLGAPRRTHVEPLTDIACTPESIVTSCGGGFVKAWARPDMGFREPHATYECLSDSEDDRDSEPPPLVAKEDDWEKLCEVNRWAPASSQARSKEPELSADSSVPHDSTPHGKATQAAADIAKGQSASQNSSGLGKGKSKVEESGPGDAGETAAPRHGKDAASASEKSVDQLMDKSTEAEHAAGEGRVMAGSAGLPSTRPDSVSEAKLET